MPEKCTVYYSTLQGPVYVDLDDEDPLDHTDTIPWQWNVTCRIDAGAPCTECDNLMQDLGYWQEQINDIVADSNESAKEDLERMCEVIQHINDALAKAIKVQDEIRDATHQKRPVHKDDLYSETPFKTVDIDDLIEDLEAAIAVFQD